MATYQFDVVPLDQGGGRVFNDDTKTWQDIGAFLNIRGAAGWRVAGTIDTTSPRRLILCWDISEVLVENETLYTGTITVGTSAVALTADLSIMEITVQSDPGNKSSLFVGSETTQAIRLAPGGFIKFSIDNTSKVYVRGGKEGQVANWIATEG